jgi:hypothetical protein
LRHLSIDRGSEPLTEATQHCSDGFGSAISIPNRGYRSSQSAIGYTSVNPAAGHDARCLGGSSRGWSSSAIWLSRKRTCDLRCDTEGDHADAYLGNVSVENKQSGTSLPDYISVEQVRGGSPQRHISSVTWVVSVGER